MKETSGEQTRRLALLLPLLQWIKAKQPSKQQGDALCAVPGILQSVIQLIHHHGLSMDSLCAGGNGTS